MDADEKICKKLEELSVKPKTLEAESCPRFDKYVDDLDCKLILIKFLIAEKKKRVADKKAREEETARLSAEKELEESLMKF